MLPERYQVDAQSQATVSNDTFTVGYLRASGVTSPLSRYLFAAYSHVSVPL